MSPPVPRLASSVMLLRRNPHLEVLMVLRPARGFFGGLVVFPGGALEECDFTFEGSEPDLSFRIAGLRETAEEVGVVVGEDGVQPARRRLDGPIRGREMLETQSPQAWRAGMDRMHLVSRWVTPEAAPTRFDTRFYALEIEGDPELVLDDAELVDHRWVSPTEALAKHAEGAWDMILPTLSHLRWLSKRETPAEVFDAADGTDGLTVIQPEMHDGRLLVRYRCEHED